MTQQGSVAGGAGARNAGGFMPPAKPGREYRDRVGIERFVRAQILLEGGDASQVLGMKLLNAHPWQPFPSLVNPAHGLCVGRDLTATARAKAPDAAEWCVLTLRVGRRCDSPSDEALEEGRSIADDALRSKRLAQGPAIGWVRFDYDPLEDAYQLRLTALMRVAAEVARREFETNLGIEGLEAVIAEVRRLRHWRADVLDVAVDFGAASWADVRPTATKRILSPLTGTPARRVLKFMHRTTPHEFMVARDLPFPGSEELLESALL